MMELYGQCVYYVTTGLKAGIYFMLHNECVHVCHNIVRAKHDYFSLYLWFAKCISNLALRVLATAIPENIIL